MRALLDVNILIALFDPDHTFHERAHSWWASNTMQGWASCPLTENGVVRIMSNPGYSKKVRFTPIELIETLRTFARQSDHEFWPDPISLCDPGIFRADRIHGSRQITDLYLVGLATKQGGRLVTFDSRMPLQAITSAKAENIVVV
jgi:toxin-antitoxin system PIN domain toxin